MTAEHRLDSGPPFDLTCTVARDGQGYACRIACRIARNDARATPREARLAHEAAHQLGRGARARVRCTVRLGAAPAGPTEEAALELAVRGLVRSAARRLEHRRLRASLEQGLAARLASDADDGLAARVDTFLEAPLGELRARHRGAIAVAHAAHFDRRVVIFAPLYLCSACLNDCAYCGFRRSARVARLKLSPDEALVEARCLAQRGQRTLDLVTGEIPTDVFVAYVAEVTRLVLERTPVSRVNLNLGALSEEQYRHLRAAGAQGYHLYQETYDEGVYFDVHRAGPKRDMANRLEASRRALRAGFRTIGLGVLLGLGPVRGDLIRLARHAYALRREFPGVRLGFSLPRIQEAGQHGDLVAAARVDDDTFAKALLFLRLEFPDAHLTLTTREGPALRDRLLCFGVTKVSAGVSTAPGGYTGVRDGDTRQFSVRDQRPATELARRILAAGLVPAFA